MNIKSIQKSLKTYLPKTAGRNNKGRITIFHRGGGHKQLFRKIDFKQQNYQGKIIKIEKDPKRSANIALIYDLTNKKYKYILAPNNIKENTILNFENFNKKYSIASNKKLTNIKLFRKLGNRFLLKDIPINTEIYNIEIKPNKGGQLVRAAGTTAIIIQKQKKLC